MTDIDAFFCNLRTVLLLELMLRVLDINLLLISMSLTVVHVIQTIVCRLIFVVYTGYGLFSSRFRKPAITCISIVISSSPFFDDSSPSSSQSSSVRLVYLVRVIVSVLRVSFRSKYLTEIN